MSTHPVPPSPLAFAATTAPARSGHPAGTGTHRPSATAPMHAGRLQRAMALILTASAAAAPTIARAADAPPVFVDIEMEGNGWAGENCEGGDWSLGWNGPVAVELGPTDDLLQSYTAFDTTHEHQPAMRPARFNATPVRCRDSNGNVVLRGDVTRNGSNQVHFTVALAESGGVGSPGFMFTADELGVCRVRASGMSLDSPVMVNATTAGPTQLQTPFDITSEDLKRGFDKTYRFDGTVIGVAPMCMGAELTRGTLRMRYKSGEDDPTVAFDACLHLAKNETRALSAQGSPAGGTYRWVARGNPFDVRSTGGNTAEARGRMTGRGGVDVIYERNGRSAEATVAGSVVDVISINGGAPIPKLGLYGANGLLLRDTYDFPLKLDPVDGDVRMTVADEPLASVVNSSTKVQIQPVKRGRTRLQGKTLCGTPVGPEVPIVIVRCDDEVKAQLRTQQAQIRRDIDQLVKRITQLTASADFQKAATEIEQSTKDLALKTGESIIGTLTARDKNGAKVLEKFGVLLPKQMVINQNRIEAVTTIYDLGDLMNDGGEAVDRNADGWAIAKPYIGAAIKLSGSELLGLAKTYFEAYQAAKKFGEQLGTLAGVMEQLENLEPQLDHAVKEYVRITTRLEYCEREDLGTTKPPKPEPVPPKPTPTPTPTPTPVPVDEPTPIEIPVPEEPVPPPPPLPPSQPPGKAVVGLACRIQDLRAPGVAQRLQALRQNVLATAASTPAPGTKESAAALDGITTATIDTALARAAELRTLQGFGADLRTLEKIAQAQQKNADGAKKQLEEWQAAVARMSGAMESPRDVALAEFQRLRTAFSTFAIGSAQRGDASVDTLLETDECRDRLEVKVDQVRARYN